MAGQINLSSLVVSTVVGPTGATGAFGATGPLGTVATNLSTISDGNTKTATIVFVATNTNSPANTSANLTYNTVTSTVTTGSLNTLANTINGVKILNQSVAITSNTISVNTVETYVSSAFAIGPNSLIVGDTFYFRLAGAANSTVANLVTANLRIGTAGTTADTTAIPAVVIGATSGVAVPFVLEFFFTVRTLGAAGTAIGSYTLTNSGTTGISANLHNIIANALFPINTTQTNFMGVSFKTAATTTNAIFYMVESRRWI